MNRRFNDLETKMQFYVDQGESWGFSLNELSTYAAERICFDFSNDQNQTIIDIGYNEFIKLLVHQGKCLFEENNDYVSASNDTECLKYVLFCLVNFMIDEKRNDQFIENSLKGISLREKFSEMVNKTSNINTFTSLFFDYCRENQINPRYILLMYISVEKDLIDSTNNSIENEDTSDDLVINPCRKSDKEKLLKLQGFAGGDVNIINRFIQDNDISDIYILKRGNQILGNFGVMYDDEELADEDNNLSLYMFISADDIPEAVTYIDFIVDYVKDSYYFKRCQLRLTDAGPFGNEASMLKCITSSKKFTLDSKYGHSVWWYGFDQE